jgi:hypothetical protein
VKEEEISAPFDMSDLQANDEWYVAVNGVPVGPIRVAEIRRKAANGAVTEDSLAWQEGLDEWRPVRSFADLAAAVREAIAGGRPSLAPPASEGRASLRPTAGARGTVGGAHGAPSRRSVLPSEPRSNVVPISSRLATAEKLATEPHIEDIPLTSEPPPAALPAPEQVADPFAAPAAAPVAAPRPVAAPDETEPPQRKREVPWIPIAMIAGAMTFGGVAGMVAFSRPAAAPQVIIQQVPVPTPVGPAASSVGNADTPAPETTASASKGPSSGGSKGPAAAASTASGPKGLDLHGLGLGGHVGPGSDDQADRPAAGQCLSGGMVQRVVGEHQVGVRRTCWDKSASTKAAANVSLALTVQGDGSTSGVSASGDDPAVASCIASDARSWRFPPMGCSQAVNIPFHFVRQ